MSHGHGHHHHPQPPPSTAMAAAIPCRRSWGRNVLVLNKFYQAIRVINVRRAFSLLCREMAEVVHIETDAKGQSKWQNFNFADWQELSQLKAEFEPDELRLDPHGAVPDRGAADHPPAGLRQAPAAGREVQPPQHLRPRLQPLPVLRQEDSRPPSCRSTTSCPRARAARARWENIVCCCVKCNVKKGGRTPEQAHMHLITKPVKPKRSPVINIRLADERYASWKQFLDTAYWTVELK